MPWYSHRMLLGGAASVCLVIVGGTMVWKTQQLNPEVARLEPAAAAAAAAAVAAPPAPEPAARTDAPLSAQDESAQLQAQKQDAQAKARAAAKKTLDLAEEIQEIARLKMGVSRAPGC